MSARLAFGVALVLLLTGAAIATNGYGDDGFKAVSDAGCANNSWSPEVVTFYGDKATVTQKLSNFEMKLPERRVFLFVVETSDGAEVRLYERIGKESKFTVTQWKTKSGTEFIGEVQSSILENRGVHCAGEQVKAIFTRASKGEAKSLEAVPAPESSRAAVGHIINEAKDTAYVKATVLLLC